MKPPATRWHLTKTQIAEFDKTGFLVLPKRICDEQLSMLRNKADLIQDNAHATLKQNTQSTDSLFTYTYFQAFLNRQLHFHLHCGFDSLALLGSPQLLCLAESLCGTDFVPTVDMMVFKHKRNDAPIPWHQDLIYQSDRYRVITIGIYLDDSDASDGALKVIQGTADKKQDICAIIDNPPTDVVEIPIKAGTVLIHNPMIVHCSDNLKVQDKRRTLYYEFRPMSQVINEESWPEKLLERRLDLLASSIDLYRRTNPDAEPFEWHPDEQFSSRTIHSQLAPLYLDPIPFNSANFCTDRK